MSDVAVHDETPPVAPRGTVVVFVGRGEHPGVYERLGRRLAVDGYRVRVVPGHSDDETLGIARDALGSEPVRPVVLLGSDGGAARATRLAAPLGADAIVVGGLVPPGTGLARFDDWQDELAARTSCPAHRGRLDGDDSLEHDAYAAGPDTRIESAPSVPVLALHGATDPVVPFDSVRPVLDELDAEVLTVTDGVHDVFNDIQHRSVAASVVLFLEQLRAGGSRIVRRVHGADVAVG